MAPTLLWLLLGCVCGSGAGGGNGICLPGSGRAEAGVLEVYLLAGQSNMDGFSPVTGLPPSLRGDQTDVRLYWSESGELGPLRPTSSLGPQYTGPEVTFGRTLADGGRDVAIVKYAVSGTSLAEYWSPGDRQSGAVGLGWTDLVDTIAAAEAELDATGERWRWAGLVWMQGESDAQDEAMAAAYETNLARFVEAVRGEIGSGDLPVVVGLIAEDAPWAKQVRDAQRAVAGEDRDILLVETADLPRDGGAGPHYDGTGIRVLGARFAQALLGEPLADAPTQAITYEDGRVEPAGSRTVGWTVRTDRPLLVTDVGAFGTTQLPGTQEWGVWDADSGALVARGAVPGWLEAPTSRRDSFWYVAVDPFELPPGEYVLGASALQGAGGEVAYWARGPVGDALTFGEGRQVDGNGLALPTDPVDTGVGLGLLGPNFAYVADR